MDQNERLINECRCAVAKETEKIKKLYLVSCFLFLPFMRETSPPKSNAQLDWWWLAALNVLSICVAWLFRTLEIVCVSLFQRVVNLKSLKPQVCAHQRMHRPAKRETIDEKKSLSRNAAWLRRKKRSLKYAAVYFPKRQRNEISCARREGKGKNR